MIDEVISTISPLDNVAMAACQERIDNLTKPLNSLQGFEELAVQLAGITGNARPSEINAGLILMAGDEGAELEDGNTNTKGLIEDFCQGVSPIHVFAKHVSAEVMLADVGVAQDVAAFPIIHEKIAYGTQNFRLGAAMSQEEAKRAVEAGIKMAQRNLQPYSVIGIGALRSDDSTASLAVINNFSEASADVWDILRRGGSFEIAGLAGVILGAAAVKKAVVLDGLCAAAAALIAVSIAPSARGYIIASHCAPEPLHNKALNFLQLKAWLELELTKGQGIGAALGISLIQASLHMLNDMKTFSEAEVAVAEDGPGALKQKK